MTLRLEIISAQRQQLGKRAGFVLADSGCSIGRALDNDWPLPDMSRFLSAHHVRIHFRAGEYFLEDTSSNGTYVNESVAPLGRRGTRVLLHAGDVLRMGEYRVLVSIDEQPPTAATPDSQTQADMTVHSVKPLRDAKGRHVSADESIDFSALVRAGDAASTLRRMGTARQARDGDLGDALTIDSLLPQTGTTSRMDGATRPHNPVESSELDSTMVKLAEQDRLARLRASERGRIEGTDSVPMLDPRSALHAFCRGAGIQAGRLTMQNETQGLQLAGRLLREALLGLKEVLRAQQAFVDRHGIDREAPEGRSPLDTNTDEYLLELLTGHEKRRFDAVMRLRDQFAYAGEHAAAIDPALRSALEQFLAHLAPEQLASGTDAAANWNRYSEVYRNLLQARDGRLPHLFLEALAQAYQAARSSRSGSEP